MTRDIYVEGDNVEIGESVYLVIGTEPLQLRNVEYDRNYNEDVDMASFVADAKAGVEDAIVEGFNFRLSGFIFHDALKDRLARRFSPRETKLLKEKKAWIKFYPRVNTDMEIEGFWFINTSDELFLKIQPRTYAELLTRLCSSTEVTGPDVFRKYNVTYYNAPNAICLSFSDEDDVRLYVTDY